ncbi:hypothetical protein F2Q70_00014399 [Brassica cretica]|uniref:Uncharacterized protein n=1 Tax=Brassica cretica TaxID=69181 RepID=A0A8S9I623_BRACR|nr:hypothetical protein F2Q70_00014399 [Brassica cretica]
MRSAGCRLPSLASSAEKEAYAKVAVASSKVMETFNEYVVVMEEHVVASRNDKEIESIGSEIKRLSKEIEATKREGKMDAEKIEDLTEDWRRIHLENEALMTQTVAQKARIAALEVERDRDIRRASRIARRAIATRYREILESLKEKWTSKKKEVSAEIQLQEDFNASAAVPDWLISEVDLPQVSDDSADQDGGSSVPDDSASKLGLSLTQILPNFLRYLIAFLVRVREEGLSLGLSEFRQLVLVKRNQQNPGTFLVSPRPGRHVIEDIPYRDEKWRKQFFVFKMD